MSTAAAPRLPRPAMYALGVVVVVGIVIVTLALIEVGSRRRSLFRDPISRLADALTPTPPGTPGAGA